MGDLLYCLNATLPVFLVIALGWALRRFARIFTDESVAVINKYVFRVALPLMLFDDLLEVDFVQLWDTRFVVFGVAVTLLSIALAWLMWRVFVRQRGLAGEFIQASYRGSIAVIAVAFIQNLYGTSSVVSLLVITTVPVYNIAAVIILSLTSPGASADDRRASIRKTLIGIVTNPILLGVAVGVAASLVHLRLPVMVSKTIASIAKTASPMALLALGAGFEGKAALGRIKETVLCSAIKMVILPAIFLPVACALGFRDEMLVSILIMLGAPTTFSCYVMARNLRHEGVLTSSVVVVTSVLSALTLTAALYMLRAMGYV